MTYAVDIMLIISSPHDFPSWVPRQKLDRYRRIVEWHQFVRDLHDRGNVKWVWGSHALLSKFTMSGSQGALVAIISAKTLSEFTLIMESDPLRDVSIYLTLPLSPLVLDFELDKVRAESQSDLDIRGNVGEVYIDALRSQYRKPPSSFDGTVERVANPPNLETDLDEMEDYGVSYLLYGTGLPEQAAWTDFQRSIYEQKVQWWHTFAAAMIEGGKMTHAWATHGFCDSTIASTNRAGAVAIMPAADFEEIDQLYNLNPLQQEGTFHSIALRPIALQRKSDIAVLKRAEERYRDL